jgi:hypothetical protein
MADIQPYVRTLCLRKLPKGLGVSGAFVRREQIVDQLNSLILATLADYEVGHRIDTLRVAEQLFDDLASSGSFNELNDDFAGDYYRVSPSHVDAFRQASLSGDRISARADAIGEQRYFLDVFSAYVNGETGDATSLGVRVSVPASDRIVSLTHNQQEAIELPLSLLIDDVRSDNEIFEDGVKDRLLGQLRAGRELINSGSVRAYLLYHTLVRGLMELVARYRGRAIAVAAERLVELLIENIFQGAD